MHQIQHDTPARHDTTRHDTTQYDFTICTLIPQTPGNIVTTFKWHVNHYRVAKNVCSLGCTGIHTPALAKKTHLRQFVLKPHRQHGMTRQKIEIFLFRFVVSQGIVPCRVNTYLVCLVYAIYLVSIFVVLFRVVSDLVYKGLYLCMIKMS